jgi:hypothetical protein
VPPRSYTIAQGINTSGVICGWYSDAGLQKNRGFFFNGRTYYPYDFPGADTTLLVGENDLGHFVGIYTLGGVTTGFANTGGTPVSISIPNAASTVVTGINNRDEIVGYYYSPTDGATYAFYGDITGTLTYPIAIHDSTFTRFFGINDQLEIAGDWADPSIGNYCHGVIFSPPNHSITFDISGSYNTGATGINNGGEICGYFWDSEGTGIHGFTAQLNESN